MPSFVFAKLLIPSLNVLSDYFLVCQFGGSSYCLNIDKSRDTVTFNGKVVALKGCLTRFSLKPRAQKMAA